MVPDQELITARERDYLELSAPGLENDVEELVITHRNEWFDSRHDVVLSCEHVGVNPDGIRRVGIRLTRPGVGEEARIEAVRVVSDDHLREFDGDRLNEGDVDVEYFGELDYLDEGGEYVDYCVRRSILGDHVYLDEEISADVTGVSRVDDLVRRIISEERADGHRRYRVDASLDESGLPVMYRLGDGGTWVTVDDVEKWTFVDDPGVKAVGVV